METSRLMLLFLGNMKSAEELGSKKRNIPRFYKDSDENDQGETIFCKNNVCLYYDGTNIPGYFTLKACTINDEYTRLILHWTSNALLQQNYVTDEQVAPLSSENLSDDSWPSVFHIDLTEMKSLKFFFKDDKTSGHFVVGNYENHYKVFHFHLGGMNHLVEIFENWSLCKTMKLPYEERERKTAFAVVPIYSISPNQSFEESRYHPMTKARWKTFLNKAGQLEDVANFRKEVFFGGVFPDVRREVWPFLLHYYPFHSRASDRMIIKENKTKEYSEINEKRLNMPKAEYDKFWLNVQCTVDKDVVRTDRSHPYFAGNDNPNVEIMRQILLNYAVYQPEVGYNQGMSDLLASILSTVQDEVDAFWCFVGLMERSPFVTSPKDDSMDWQLLYLKELLRMMAVKFYAHLLLEDEGMDLLFCHRWLLLGFKREFYDLHVLRMWEACWCHYQTEYFHIFLCVAIILEYGDTAWQKSMRVDEMLNYFNNLALEMDGDLVLKKARSLLYQFRKLAAIPCTLRGLLSGPGAWDSATLPDIECTCHETSTCKHSNPPRRGKSFTRATDASKQRKSGEREISQETREGKSCDEEAMEISDASQQENGIINTKDGMPNEEETVYNCEHEGEALNTEEQQGNGQMDLKDEFQIEELRVDTSNIEQKHDGLSDSSQHVNGCINMKEDTSSDLKTLNNSDVNEQNDLVAEEQSNVKMCSSHAKCEQKDISENVSHTTYTET